MIVYYHRHKRRMIGINISKQIYLTKQKHNTMHAASTEIDKSSDSGDNWFIFDHRGRQTVHLLIVRLHVTIIIKQRSCAGGNTIRSSCDAMCAWAIIIIVKSSSRRKQYNVEFMRIQLNVQPSLCGIAHSHPNTIILHSCTYDFLLLTNNYQTQESGRQTQASQDSKANNSQPKQKPKFRYPNLMRVP